MAVMKNSYKLLCDGMGWDVMAWCGPLISEGVPDESGGRTKPTFVFIDVPGSARLPHNLMEKTVGHVMGWCSVRGADEFGLGRAPAPVFLTCREARLRAIGRASDECVD